MTSNEKINELIKCVSHCSDEEYQTILQELNFKVEDFDRYINFSSKKYIRNCVAKGDGFELILLAWEEGQKAPIHGHDGNEGWIYVIQGEFEEKRYNLNPETEDLILKSKTLISEKEVWHTSKDKSEYHSIRNSNKGRSLSLHLYKNRRLKFNVYD